MHACAQVRVLATPVKAVAIQQSIRACAGPAGSSLFPAAAAAAVAREASRVQSLTTDDAAQRASWRRIRKSHDYYCSPHALSRIYRYICHFNHKRIGQSHQSLCRIIASAKDLFIGVAVR